MKQKFEAMLNDKYNGNISDFKKALKALTKADLLRFVCHCTTYDMMDVYEIEKYYNS